MVGEPKGAPWAAAPLRADTIGEWKTSLVFWGAGADRPGWLVRCLDEFARREINLTKIESRPRRERLGSYMFFADLAGAMEDPSVAEAIASVRVMCEEVRVLGSYPSAARPAATRSASATSAPERRVGDAPPLDCGA